MQPAAELTLLQAVGIEAVLTFFLISVIQGTGDKHDRNSPCPLPSAPVGMMVAADIMAGVRIMVYHLVSIGTKWRPGGGV